MSFEPGQVITRRYVRGPLCTWVQPMRVIADDAAGLLLWQPAGSDFAKIVDADGRTAHEVTPGRMRDPRLIRTVWERADVLVLMPPKAAHAVWWFFQEGHFRGWYVNLEEPYVRRRDAVQTTDHVLDIVVTPQRHWQWKDVDEFGLRIGEPHYFDRAGADAVRAEGDRVVELIEAAAFPFDGIHTDFRPDPAWPLTRLTEEF
jgi:hypothetical protein